MWVGGGGGGEPTLTVPPMRMSAPEPATIPGFSCMRFASSSALAASVMAPMTLSVGHGDLDWLAGGHTAPVISEEYSHNVRAVSTFSTFSDWSFS